jgi:hypothetical protein
MRLIWIVLLASALASGCSTASRWRVSEKPGIADLEAALGPTVEGRVSSELLAGSIPDVPVRAHLRPCCAFGAELRPELLGIPIPFYEIPNVLGVADLGPHIYEAGMFQGASQEKPSFEADPERNGMVYTCRGGFVDTAHVRDYLDWGFYLTVEAGRILASGEDGVIALPDEGGRRRVRIRVPHPELLAQLGMRRLAIWLGSWAAWQTSVWHETATWFGWNAVPGFSEKASAVSPGDLYSNGLGARLVESIVMRRLGESEKNYNQNATNWIDAALRMLGAVPKETGWDATKAVDGLWWDSTRRVPNPRLVLRRNIDVETPLVPWRVPASRAPASLQQACAEAEPFAIGGAETVTALRLDDYVTLEIDPQSSIAAQEPFATIGPTITQADFPQILEVVREQNRAEFGAGSDRPE